MQPTRRESERTLSDADIDAIAERVIASGTKKFYLEAGMGLWGLAWKTVMVILVGLAAYGAGKH